MCPPEGTLLTLAEAGARLLAVRAAMAEAAGRVGRNPEEIALLAVSKTFPAEMVRIYLESGLSSFGESYIQEAREKIPELAAFSPAPDWHFIGHLQRNKARYAASLFSTIHSLDQIELAAELDQRARDLGKVINVYVQVNVSGEDSKSGLRPEGLPAFVKDLAGFPSLAPQGLMTMPPFDPDPEASRPYFAALRRLRDAIVPDWPGLSMGMSGDFQVAIEEGASIVRVGSALFGER